jgi:hypothetical protein
MLAFQIIGRTVAHERRQHDRHFLPAPANEYLALWSWYPNVAPAYKVACSRNSTWPAADSLKHELYADQICMKSSVWMRDAG